MRELLPLGGHHVYDWLVGRRLAHVYGRLLPHFPAGHQVLDVGCGPGHLASLLSDQGRSVVGVDKDPVQVRIAARNHPDLAFRVAPAEALPFSDESFDLVMTTESFHHWSKPEGGLAETFRVLRPGGTFLVVEGAGDMTKDDLAWVLGRRPPPGLTGASHMLFSRHGYTTESLQRDLLPVLKSSRFADLNVRRMHGWWLVEAIRPTAPLD